MPPGRKASFEIFPWTSAGLWGKRVKRHCFNELSSGNKFNGGLLFLTKLNYAEEPYRGFADSQSPLRTSVEPDRTFPDRTVPFAFCLWYSIATLLDILLNV